MSTTSLATFASRTGARAAGGGLGELPGFEQHVSQCGNIEKVTPLSPIHIHIIRRCGNAGVPNMLKLPKAAAVAVQATLWVALGSPWATLADAAPANTATQSQTTPRLHKGDLVQLSSGGLVLTVKSVSGNWVICTWFDDYGELQSTAFPIAMIAGPLTLSPDDAKPQTNGQMSPSPPWAALADAAPANTATQSQTTPVLHVGDLVRLRSGGPAMTVKRVWENWVICNWNGGYGAQSAGFPIAMIAGPLTLSPDEANPQTNGQMSSTEPSIRRSGDSSSSGQTNQNPTAQGTNQTRQVRPANAGTSMSPSTRPSRVLPLQLGTGSVEPAPVLPPVQTVIPLTQGAGPALLLPQGTVQTVIPLKQGTRSVGPALILPQGTVQTIIPLQQGTGTHPTIGVGQVRPMSPHGVIRRRF